MKNTQKGFVGIIISIIIVLLIGVGIAYIVLHKNTTVEQVQTNDVVDIDKSVNEAVLPNPSMSPYTLTNHDILSATYKISANFGGVITPPANIVFPPQTGTSNHNLSGNVYINKSGIVFENPKGEILEGFWINGYKYTDSSRTEAKVFITGNFGAGGFDDRVFIVDKINGVVVTKETICNKEPNSTCAIDGN